MSFHLNLAHPTAAVIAIFLVILVACMRWFFYKPTALKFSLTSRIKEHVSATKKYVELIPYFLRFSAVLLLALLVGQPQSVDVHSKVETEGIAIMMVLDVSGSMQCFDDFDDKRPRFEVAKQEAINFINKRDNDQIGLIFFGKDAVSRCPLTLDKTILKDCLQELNLGEVDPDGTVLSTAICMAVRRLSKAQATSKIMIVLTDGEPTQGLDVDPRLALELAQKEGIKIYTIGVGSEQGGYIYDPLFGIRPVGIRLNKELLEFFATQTKGQFFWSKKPQDMQEIYHVIDSLEKTSYETPIYRNYQELIIPFALCVLLLILFEILLSTFVWFTV